MITVYTPTVYELIRENIHGGFSNVYAHEALVGVSKINKAVYGEQARTVDSITSQDFANLYGFAQNVVPTGLAILRYKTNNYLPEYGDARLKRNRSAELILAFFAWLYKVKFQTDWNDGEFRPMPTGRKFRVDGYCEQLKLAVEIRGHGGHPCIYRTCNNFYFDNSIHPILKRTNHKICKRDSPSYTFVSWSITFKSSLIIRNFALNSHSGPLHAKSAQKVKFCKKSMRTRFSVLCWLIVNVTMH